MITVSVWIIFILSSLWNVALLAAFLSMKNENTPLNLRDWIIIIASLAIWFSTGVYLFGL